MPPRISLVECPCGTLVVLYGARTSGRSPGRGETACRRFIGGGRGPRHNTGALVTLGQPERGAARKSASAVSATGPRPRTEPSRAPRAPRGPLRLPHLVASRIISRRLERHNRRALSAGRAVKGGEKAAHSQGRGRSAPPQRVNRRRAPQRATPPRRGCPRSTHQR